MLVSIAIFLSFRHWAYDDPFITYRYARNLANGLGFVYNPGERILSTTTPLFALLLAGLSFLWPDIPKLANLIGAVSLAAGGLLLWDLGHSWKSLAVSWTGLLLYPIFSLVIITLGSETPLYLAFCLGTFAFYARSQFSAVAILAALATLTRPDGILIPVLLGIHFLLVYRGRIPRAAVLIFSGIVLAWYAFAWVYFGHPLPVTLVAKQQQGAMTISQDFVHGFFKVVSRYQDSWLYWLEALLALTGVIWAIFKARPWLLLLSWTGVYFLAFSLLGVSSYHWYYAPLAPGFVAAIGLGLEATGASLKRVSNQWQGFSRQSYQLVIVLLLAVLTLGQLYGLRNLRQDNDRRVQIYRAVGEWLSTNTPGWVKIGTLEVGIIGYYAQRQMIDFAGLIQPQIASQLSGKDNFEEAALYGVETYHPDYLVLHENLFPRLEDELILNHCRQLETFTGAPYGYDNNLLIYACMD